MAKTRKNYRIVLTGGPGAGKTTAADLFRREIGDSIVIVPEAATLLFSGGFPRIKNEGAREATQHAIYWVQRSLEDVNSEVYPDRILLCDRGTIDGAVYWPHGPDAFFSSLRTSFEEELERYDAVIFFESAAIGGKSIEGGNPIRNETVEEAVDLDRRLKSIWMRHPHFYLIPNERSFFAKITSAITTLQELVQRIPAHDLR